MSIGKSYELLKSHSARFEIRLFYIRITPFVIDTVPDHLTLRQPSRDTGVSLEINGSSVPASAPASLTLRRDRLNKEALEVTYVSTDTVRLTGGVDFEVYENDDMILCGSLERMESSWADDSRTGWGMDCYTSIGSGCSAFFQPKLGVSSPSIEVYIAGCCSGIPVILTKTIQVSPRRRVSRHPILDAIPEDQELDKDRRTRNGTVHRRHSHISEPCDDYEADEKLGLRAEDMYGGEDGQLTWFNAGVRVGVGIGLGMCVGMGIGVGLLMRSYQATTRNLRRRFF